MEDEFDGDPAEQCPECGYIYPSDEDEAQGVLSCGCPDQGFDECSVHGESGTLAEGPVEDGEGS